MVPAPIPADEAERLQNLDSYHLLDTPYESVFDEIVSLAAKICGTPYALISIVDSKRQWFKAAHGVSGVTETPRDVSFCGHAILSDELFFVPDALEDERFHDNPLVTGGLRIRVYAGMPLVSEEGYKLGTLCVLADHPMALSDAQKEALKQLSHVLTALFKARKKEARFAALGQVLDQLDDEILLVHPQTLECTYANAAARRAYAQSGGTGGLTLADIAAVASSSERRQLLEQFQSGRRDRLTLELERPGEEDASIVELRLQRLVTDNGGKLAAIGHEVSERKKLEKVQAELQGSLERHNQELSRAYGLLSDELGIAREMQLRFLPAPKCIHKVSFDWLFQASSYLGGDIFDYFPLDERYLCFHVIDVAGHGVAAALFAFNAQRQMFSSRLQTARLISKLEGDIARAAPLVMKDFNQRFAAANDSSLYLTMIFGILDAQTGEVALVQAGHPPPILSPAEGPALVSVGEGGLPIGILEDVEYEAHTLRLTPGSRLYLYSDGITECAGGGEEIFGRERMEKLLVEKRDAPLPEVRDALGRALAQWRGDADSFDDDVTFLSLEFLKANQMASGRVHAG